VVSDGLDRVIEYILRKNGINADGVFANHLIESESGEFSLQASARPRFANCQSGVCKCRIVGQPGYQLIRVVIGDGRSDFCWSKESDLLYAKGKLVEYCGKEKIACNEFDDFNEIQASLAKVSGGRFDHVVFNKPLITPAAAITVASEISSVSEPAW
jgi:2-hydroxy-3-keto-5-methylthiopentenyl-1-phosphate phosphatase